MTVSSRLPPPTTIPAASKRVQCSVAKSGGEMDLLRRSHCLTASCGKPERQRDLLILASASLHVIYPPCASQESAQSLVRCTRHVASHRDLLFWPIRWCAVCVAANGREPGFGGAAWRWSHLSISQKISKLSPARSLEHVGFCHKLVCVFCLAKVPLVVFD